MIIATGALSQDALTTLATSLWRHFDDLLDRDGTLTDPDFTSPNVASLIVRWGVSVETRERPAPHRQWQLLAHPSEITRACFEGIYNFNIPQQEAVIVGELRPDLCIEHTGIAGSVTIAVKLTNNQKTGSMMSDLEVHFAGDYIFNHGSRTGLFGIDFRQRPSGRA